MKVEFNYDKSQLTSIDELTVSVADLRDLVQAFTIGSDAQKIQELKIILEGERVRLQGNAVTTMQGMMVV